MKTMTTTSSTVWRQSDPEPRWLEGIAATEALRSCSDDPETEAKRGSNRPSIHGSSPEAGLGQLSWICHLVQSRSAMVVRRATAK